MQQKPIKVMVFGVFDIIHEGHRYFLRNAKNLGSELVVVVATDSSVQTLKKVPSHHSLQERIANLESEKIADAVVAGDEHIGNWDIISKYQPDIIALGYDQENLADALDSFIQKTKSRIKIMRIEPYDDGSLHSSMLRKKLL